MSAENSQKEQAAEKNESNDTSKQYNDELDEEFEEKLVKKSSIVELQSTLDSFENPKGLETAINSPLLNGPQLDAVKLMSLQKKLMGMTQTQQSQFKEMLTSILKNNNFGLGTKENLSSVSNAHRSGAAEKLREAIARKGLSRKSKTARNFTSDRNQTTSKDLHHKHNADTKIENLDNLSLTKDSANQHIHSDACNHEHEPKHEHEPHKLKSNESFKKNEMTDGIENSESSKIIPGKNAKRNKNRRTIAKKWLQKAQ